MKKVSIFIARTIWLFSIVVSLQLTRAAEKLRIKFRQFPYRVLSCRLRLYRNYITFTLRLRRIYVASTTRLRRASTIA